jgi:hypothetical protein
MLNIYKINKPSSNIKQVAIKIFVFIVVFLTLILHSGESNKASAQVIDPQTRANLVRTEMDYWSGVNAGGFLYWQYSGRPEDGFPADNFSFWEGDPICNALYDYRNDFNFIGVNMHSLYVAVANGTLNHTLDYLSSSCGVNMIRIFGRPEHGGIPVTSQIVDAAANYGIKIIVSLCDAAFGCGQFGYYSGPSSSFDPTGWYADGYRTFINPDPNNPYPGTFLDYARDMAQALSGKPAIYGIELLNEPTCEHAPNQDFCVETYVSWAHNVALAIHSVDPNIAVGIGQKASNDTARGDAPNDGVPGRPPDFVYSNENSNLTITSGHFYNGVERSHVVDARFRAANELNNRFFYIGEFGVNPYAAPIEPPPPIPPVTPPPPPGTTPPPPGSSGGGLQCVGNEISTYMTDLVAAANAGNGLQHIRLLTPAFNMTNPNGAAIANAMDTALGGNWSGIYGIAGNAYNCCGNTITGHIDAFRTATGGSGLDGLPVLVTETGDLGEKDVVAIGIEMDTVQGSGDYIGALLFNALGTNPDPNFDKHEFGDDQIRAICGPGGCGKLGINSATYYPESSQFYDRVRGFGMNFTLSISNIDDSTTQGVQAALQRGLTPVIRVGTAHAAGPLAVAYGQYLAWLDDQISGTVYAIAGPNEPQTECWAAPNCGCDITSGPGPDPVGQGRHPIDEGFWLGKYSCITDSTDPEFHPLRPYPASSCDLLIPRSFPEAPLSLAGCSTTNLIGLCASGLSRCSGTNYCCANTNLCSVASARMQEYADHLKYNTFACGTNLAFSNLERFDPYGYYDIYGQNNTGSTVTNFNGTEYLHTYCPPVDPATSQTTGTYTQTCYRTVGFDIYTDFSQSNVGIFGNTQNDNFTDEQKVNNYLGWYFTGTPQIGDRALLDPNDTQSTFASPSGVIRWSDMDRLINFSGPLRKLLPYDAMVTIRNALINTVQDNQGVGDENIHDYALDTQTLIRLSNIFPEMEEFWPHIPNSTLEDIPGEAYPAAQDQGIGAITDPATGLSTAPDQFTITCAVGAHLSCPAGGSNPPPAPPPPGPPPSGGGVGGCYDTCDPNAQYPCQPALSCRDRYGFGEYFCWAPRCDITPTPTPEPGGICFSSCYSTADCQSGLTCLQQGYCYDACLCGGQCP